MAAHPIVVVDDEIIEKIPEAFRSDPRYQKGERLQLVPVWDETEEAAADGYKGDWHRLDGLLAGEEFDTTEWKRQQREEELAHDERKFGVKRPSW